MTEVIMNVSEVYNEYRLNIRKNALLIVCNILILLTLFLLLFGIVWADD
jgi:amino acid permease